MSYRKTRIVGGRSFIQPALVPLAEREAVAFFRCPAPARKIGVARTSDGGLTWDDVGYTALPNPNSGLDALGLGGARVLIAFNDDPTVERDNIRLAVSGDGGATWTRVATLEEGRGERFSYPFLKRTSDGMVHVVYTWHSRRIKHVAFNEAWLEARLAEAGVGRATHPWPTTGRKEEPGR